MPRSPCGWRGPLPPPPSVCIPYQPLAPLTAWRRTAAAGSGVGTEADPSCGAAPQRFSAPQQASPRSRISRTPSPDRSYYAAGYHREHVPPVVFGAGLVGELPEILAAPGQQLLEGSASSSQRQASPQRSALQKEMSHRSSEIDAHPPQHQQLQLQQVQCDSGQQQPQLQQVQCQSDQGGRSCEALAPDQADPRHRGSVDSTASTDMAANDTATDAASATKGQLSHLSDDTMWLEAELRVEEKYEEKEQEEEEEQQETDQEDQQEGQGALQEVRSRGCAGHPDSCAEACKFVATKRGCKDGEDCDHCHLCVWKSHLRVRRKRGAGSKSGHRGRAAAAADAAAPLVNERSVERPQ